MIHVSASQILQPELGASAGARCSVVVNTPARRPAGHVFDLAFGRSLKINKFIIDLSSHVDQFKLHTEKKITGKESGRCDIGHKTRG